MCCVIYFDFNKKYYFSTQVFIGNAGQQVKVLCMMGLWLVPIHVANILSCVEPEYVTTTLSLPS